jgi:hypothetical protein
VGNADGDAYGEGGKRDVIYELRTYWVEPKFRAGYEEWANTVALPVLQGQFGFRVVGFWVVESSRPSRATFPAVDDPFTVAWVIAWKDEAERDLAWKTVLASPEWAECQQQVKAITGRLIEANTDAEDDAKLRDLAAASGFMYRGSYHLMRGIERSPLQ